MARNNKMFLYKKQVEHAAFWIHEEIAATDRAVVESLASKRYNDAHSFNEFKRGLEKALLYISRVINPDENKEIEKERGVVL